jgi:hypothetical protein
MGKIDTLVFPKSIIIRPSNEKFDSSFVIKADTLRTKIDREVEETARRLGAFHKPLKVDFRPKFGLAVQKDKVKDRR